MNYIGDILHRVLGRIQSLFFGDAYDYAGMTSAENVSYLVLEEARRFGLAMNRFQLEDALYLLQSTFLLEKKKALFSDDIEVCVRGPSIHSIRTKYVGYGAEPMYEDGVYDPVLSADDEAFLRASVKDVLSAGLFSLHLRANRQGGAWSMVMQTGGTNGIIPKDVLADLATESLKKD